ncbi:MULTISPECIES: Na+/H+ antiporter subunit E [Rhodococcus]|uniref:Na+/H+ antiporter subunit E n=1 Tax=Rhodococcus pseudokoreensis TaxID=2811421 RepID=A0A974W9R4_9NOCA|nr:MULTISPECIES: Na+/H+ antiporter subunit E [Rhodococcus]MBV6759625.1 Na+/H+ antiporter subunit E [Rhodococcus opacus]QSE93352.1 Na+/H+ antiporter subunit E [Rhodococcus pseudokoreensis]
MKRERLLQFGALLWLMSVWILLWGNVSWGNILGGLAVGALIMVLMPLPRVPVEGRVHFLPLLRLAVMFVYYSIQSSLQIAWLALRPGPPPVTGVLRYQLGIKSDLVLTLCIDVLNLIPGTMVLEIDQVRRIVYVHVLDMGSQKAVSQFYRTVAQLERLFIEAFERDSDWKPSPWHNRDQQYDDPAQEGSS